ncbi:hypothetical protein AAEO56_06065 [Flavobacterium sp. DGU11]|uniref:YtkA-like n=1 Tax=Flavobacterium arundinis TaxID=3139143 RepID=A0ABU9HV18_9FLAO
MKTLKYLSLIIIAFFSSCSSDEPETVTINELQGLTLVQEMPNDTHIVELYTPTGTLQQGYNAVSLRIKDKTTGTYETDATVSWMPVMHMASMQHSCPFSGIAKTPGKETLYNGYIVFQMAQNDIEYWTLQVNYTLNGNDYSVSETINVPASSKRRVASFTGTDGSKYVIALIEPIAPRVAVNNVTAGLFKMESMVSYPAVDGYTIKIDPRMPSMGNHGSPNNVDLTQAADGLYNGKLSLTMSGYWKINLQLLNTENVVVKGEPVTETVPESSIFFEIEF